MSSKQFKSYDSKCVCDICSCGNHNCPTHKFPRTNTEKSVFKTDFIPQNPNKNQPFKDKQQYIDRPYDSQYLRSIYKNDYQKKQTFDPKVKRKQQYIHANVPFYSDTEYNNQYVPHESGNRIRPVTAQSKPMNIPFANKSTYGNDFVNFQRNRPPKVGPQVQDYQTPYIGFDNSSTYAQDFNNKPIEPAKRFDKKEGPSTTNIPFNADSIYKQSYQRFENKEKVCDITRMPQRPNFCGSGQNHLYYVAKDNRWK